MASNALRVAALIAALPLVLPGQTPAQAAKDHAADGVHAIPVPSVPATRRVGAIKIDGILDEPAWNAAPPVTDFPQIQPDEGKPPTQKTEMRFLYDNDAIYIGAGMYDTEGAAGVHT
jgi:hypothetical protein